MTGFTKAARADASASLTMRSRIALALITIAALAVAAVALRYLAPGTPGAPASVLANAYADPFLPLHAGLGAAALVLGPWQFLPGLRRRRRGLHRTLGAAYLLSCLIAGAAGLMLALGTTAGPVAGLGFAALALAWIGTTLAGAVNALGGRFAAHRRWMIRSFALTLAAVTLRLQLGLGGVSALEFEIVYLTAAWACWIPNLILAEFYILATGLGAQNQPASRRAG